MLRLITHRQLHNDDEEHGRSLHLTNDQSAEEDKLEKHKHSRSRACTLTFRAMLCLLVFQLYLYYSHGFTTIGSDSTTSVQDKIENQVKLHWSKYGDSSTNTSTLEEETTHLLTTTPRKKLLIAQFTDSSKYNRMLDVSQKVNRAYAKHWKHDYLAYIGLPFHGKQNYHANFDKVIILKQAQTLEYDGVLLLDADAVLVDFEQDIASTDLTNDQFAIFAQFQYENYESFHFHSFNAGVTLWNLKHIRTNQIIQMWYIVSKFSVQNNLQAISEGLFGDQSLLHILLFPMYPFVGGPSHLINTRPDTQVSRSIQHVKRPDMFIWDKPVDDRIQIIQSYADQACAKYMPSCEGIPDKIGL